MDAAGIQLRSPRPSLPRLTAVAALLVVATLVPSAGRTAELYPFASHPMSYAAGTILPNHVSQATLDQAVRDFYDAWKIRFLRQTCGAGRWVVLTETDASNLTVSEGHGYGMMLMALLAGYEPNAQAIFDGMLAYFRAHPSAFHDHLMGVVPEPLVHDARGRLRQRVGR